MALQNNHGAGSPVEITVQYFDGCPHWEAVDRRLSALIAAGLEATVRHERIGDEATAVEKGFRGSPSVLIDGVDPFADSETPVGLTCRIYRSEHGPAGAPTLEQLRTAIAAAGER